ncbi:Flp/Fap pilin component [Vibrio aerogenes CECT 7868]|uniref:Flp/Fap pilin component n=1 Tax=Vibrio aerogenes CECT 7868 TaxID=1216006 RepID=A0A1M5ZQV3_9VIBR|nr:Flp family type IVb pilin [Vibrio aerogenes]SHI26735.1 Flp/Fap pilin component [Vibrio aerogenes CECT 7868]
MLAQLCLAAKRAVVRFKNDIRGVTAIEYAIIGVAVSAIVLAVFVTDTGGLKGALSDAVTTISDNISAADDSSSSSSSSSSGNNGNGNGNN